MPVVTIARVLQRLDAGRVDPLYLLFGAETYLMREYVSVCSERILGTAPRDFNHDVFDASAETLQEALGLAATLPMMASHRVVVLHGVQNLRKADVQRLDTYAEAPSESTALICTSTETDPKKLPPRLWQRAVAVACEPLDGAPLRAWVRQKVQACGYTITPEAVETFLQDQPHDLWQLESEIEKLCTYAGDTQSIGPTEVREVCEASPLHSIFALSDAVGARRIGPAFTLIEGLLQQGEPPLVVFSLIVRHIRLLWSVRQLLQQHQSVSQIARTLRLPLRVCRQLAEQSRWFSSDRLQGLYRAAIEADLAFKTSPRPPKSILEALVLELCAGC